MHDDHELIEALRRGDHGAVDELLARYEPAIYRFGLRMCHDRDDARDVLQETLLAAARGARDFRGDSSLTSWLYAIARSFCIKKRRHGKHAPTTFIAVDEVSDLASDQPRPDEMAEAHELRAKLERAIATLEPAYREVLVLRDVEGLTAPEVATTLGIGVDAVKSRLHRARMLVRAHFAGDVPPSPSCPDVIEMLSRHVEGEIANEDCAKMDAHVSTCTRCSAACDSLRQTLQLCGDDRTVAVPRDVQARLRDAIRRVVRERA